MVASRLAELAVMALVAGVVAVVVGTTADNVPVARAEHVRCTTGSDENIPPNEIRVRITRATPERVDTVNFKAYVKIVVTGEWPHPSRAAAYEAGALASKTFAWWYVNHHQHDFILPSTGECYDIDDSVLQRYEPTLTIPPAVAYGVEQTWNWLQQIGGALIYRTHHESGCPDPDRPDLCPPGATDACGQLYLGPTDGRRMSQNGSKSCADSFHTWAQIINIYYYDNPTYPGDHTYGQWHGALPWGPAAITPASVSAATWKFMGATQCAAPTTFGYGNPSDIKIIGDWTGNGSLRAGVVRVGAGGLTWYFRKSPTQTLSYSFGAYGDIPVVGDWDNNGTWTAGVFRGMNTWFLTNSTPPSPPVVHYTAYFGDGGLDTPVPGKWQQIPGTQATAVGVVRLGPGPLQWHEGNGNNGSVGLIRPPFGYGNGTDRPIAGDWVADGFTYFGPGVVRDDSDSCQGVPINQGWYVNYTNDPGPADLWFRYERIWP